MANNGDGISWWPKAVPWLSMAMVASNGGGSSSGDWRQSQSTIGDGHMVVDG